MPLSDHYLSRISALEAELHALVAAVEAAGTSVRYEVVEASDEARDVLDDPDFNRASANPNMFQARMNALDSALGWLISRCDHAGDALPYEVASVVEEARGVVAAHGEV